MARTMKKFSEGGALGKYNRRMADIKKDFAKDSAGKSGRALEVLEAKRAQRIADAEDDRAKRTGGDRTATRAAERLAESNLKKTRKYGAPKAVTTEASVSQPKIPNTLGALTAPKSGLATAAKKTPVKITKTPVVTPTVKKVEDKPKPPAVDIAKSDSPSDQGFSSKQRGRIAPKSTKTEVKKDTGTASKGPSTKTGIHPNSIAARIMRGDLFKTSDAFRKSQEAKGYGKAKGGKVMKYAKGGSTPPQPTAAERKAGAKFRESIKDIKPTPEQAAAIRRGNRSEAATTLKKYSGAKQKLADAARRGQIGMAKGGKATKFGKAMVKKSADTKGRAMMKFAKGGSIDGCAVRGKTKAKRVTMKNGGSC